MFDNLKQKIKDYKLKRYYEKEEKRLLSQKFPMVPGREYSPAVVKISPVDGKMYVFPPRRNPTTETLLCDICGPTWWTTSRTIVYMDPLTSSSRTQNNSSKTTPPFQRGNAISSIPTSTNPRIQIKVCALSSGMKMASTTWKPLAITASQNMLILHPQTKKIETGYRQKKIKRSKYEGDISCRCHGKVV